MRRLLSLDYLVDVAAVTITALVGTIALGRFLDSSVAHKLDTAPVVGDLVIGVRNAVGQVYDPTRLP